MSEFLDHFQPVAGRSEPVKLELARRFKASMTPAEKVLWGRLRAGRLGGLHFRRQCVIRGFIADFYCHEAQLVVEVDGGVHEGQADYDKERDDILRSLNLRVMRFSNDAVLNRIASVLETITDAADN